MHTPWAMSYRQLLAKCGDYAATLNPAAGYYTTIVKRKSEIKIASESLWNGVMKYRRPNL